MHENDEMAEGLDYLLNQFSAKVLRQLVFNSLTF